MKNRKYLLSFVMDEDRSDIDFLGHETIKEDEYHNTVLLVNRDDRDIFLKHNQLTIKPQYDEQIDDVYNLIVRGTTMYGQSWNSQAHKDVWEMRNAGVIQ